jgi:CheY-like chemotaxis protein
MPVLVVEDDAATRDAVVAMLEELGIIGIETANDGKQATEALKNALRHSYSRSYDAES